MQFNYVYIVGQISILKDTNGFIINLHKALKSQATHLTFEKFCNDQKKEMVLSTVVTSAVVLCSHAMLVINMLIESTFLPIEV